MAHLPRMLKSQSIQYKSLERAYLVAEFKRNRNVSKWIIILRWITITEISSVWFDGRWWKRHLLRRYRRQHPSQNTYPYRKPQLLSDAIWIPIPTYPCLPCNRPRKLQITTHFLSPHTRISLSYIGRQSNHRKPGRALHFIIQLQSAALSILQTFIKPMLPLLKKWVSNQIAEGVGLHGLILLESVQIDLLFHECWKSLNVGT